MRLADVNILVNAHRAENRGQPFFHEWLTTHLEGPATFLYCEWILSAFVRIVTHPKIYTRPTPLPVALQFVDEIRSRPNGVALMPGARHWELFAELAGTHACVGNDVPDVYLAALAIEADAEWVTSDRGFERFEPTLRWKLLTARKEVGDET